MTMTNEEIARDYRLAKNGLKQAHILAELNRCSVDEIVRILQEQGVKVDGRLTQKGRTHASPKKAAATANPKPAAPKPEEPKLEEPKEDPDPVNHPNHYNRGPIECIEAILAAVTGLPAAEAWLAGQIIKYVWRYKWKNGAEDLRKAMFYLDRLIMEVEGVDV